MKRIAIFSIISFLLLAGSEIFAQGIPETINYQGVLKDASGNIVPDGNYNITFRLYDLSSTVIWMESKVVSIADGMINTRLGSVVPMSYSIFNGPLWLGITIESGSELSPRVALTSVPYSFMAMNVADAMVVKSLNGLKDNVNLLAGSNITITPSGNNLTISATGGGGGTVTQVNTGAGLTGGPITTTGTISIPNDGITSAMLQSNSVTSAKITDGTIVTADLGDNSVTSAKIVDGTIAAADLASNSVTTLKIADNNVTAAKILDEPGYNYNNTGNSNTLYPLTASGQSFTSVTLNAPAAGFAVVYAHADVFITHTSGTFDNVILKVSRTSGDITSPSYGTTLVRIPAAWPTAATSDIVHGISITAVFTVTAGNNTFHLNGYRSSGASSSLLKPEIAVIFVPTRYGTGAELNDNIPVINDTDLILGQ